MTEITVTKLIGNAVLKSSSDESVVSTKLISNSVFKPDGTEAVTAIKLVACVVYKPIIEDPVGQAMIMSM